MSSGSPGGHPDFFSSAGSLTGRPIFNTTNPNSNMNSFQHQQSSYRGGLLPDRSDAGFGKRTLAQFQGQYNQQQFHHRQPNPLFLQQQQQTQQQHQQQQLNGIGIGGFMRSVKPRLFHNASPISPLSPIETLPDSGANPMMMARYASLRNHINNNNNSPITFGSGSIVPNPPPSSYNPNNLMIQNGVILTAKPPAEDSEKNMRHRLQELEKQLLDDDDDEQVNAEGDASGGCDDSVSVITGNEWNDAIQDLIGSNQKPQPQQQLQKQVNTGSPSSSTSSCASTVASPLPICSKQSIIDAAAAIADGRTEAAAEMVTRLNQNSNPRATPEQRLAYYMSLALKSKMTNLEGQKVSSCSATEIRSKEQYESVQLLYQHSSCFRLGFLAAILAIIEATSDAKALHVIDFDMGDGGQYQHLLQLLSMRKSGKPLSVRITAVDIAESSCLGGAVDEYQLSAVKQKLSRLSDRVGVPLELKVTCLKVSDLSRESLGSSGDEVVAVNLAYGLSKLPDESVSTENARDELLRRVKWLKARIVTVVEQEMNCNTSPFQTRVSECCSFYGALLESLDSFPGRDELERVRVEEGLGRRMVNSVACEGGDRVERCEVFGKWRARMRMAGLEMKSVSQNVVESLSSMINSNNNKSADGVGTRVGSPLFVKKESGGVCFGWVGRVLTVTSAWR